MNDQPKDAYLPSAHITNQGVWVATVTHPDGWYECGHAHSSERFARACAERWAAAMNPAIPRHEDCTECRGNGDLLCPSCNGSDIARDGSDGCPDCEGGTVECRSEIHDAAIAAALNAPSEASDE